MTLVTLKEILCEAVENRYAVGAFDTFNHALTEGILTAAEARQRPVILMAVSQSFAAPGSRNFFKYVVDRCERSSVPVALHLDHGPSVEAVLQAIHLGFTSVMLDGSSLPIEDNIAITRQVCELAHACQISVEGEIGHVAGHEGDMLNGNVPDESAYTKVEDAARFVRETGVDALAIAVGTVHGVFRGVPNLDYARLSAIRDAVSIPLVLHGGSGLSAEDFRQAIRCGINKINFFTEMSLGGAEAVETYLRQNAGKHHFMELVDVGVNRVSEIVGERIDIFGTQPLRIQPDRL